jgi:PAS domain S-box-containing protein
MLDNSEFPWKKYFFDEFWEPILILDAKYHIYDANNKLLELSGYEKKELIGKSPNFLLEHIFSDNRSESDIFDRKILNSKLISRTGLKIPIKIAFQFYKSMSSEGNIWYFFSFMQDISHETHLFRQLNATKSYALATNQIGTVVYRQSDLGPDVWYHDRLQFLERRFPIREEIKNELLKIGLILTTALGQGGAYTKGLSEIPIYDYDVIGVCYTKIVKDKEAKDVRLKEKTYTIIATFFPKKLSSLIVKHDELEAIIKKILDPIDNIEQFNKKLIKKLKKRIVKLEEVADSVDLLF